MRNRAFVMIIHGAGQIRKYEDDKRINFNICVWWPFSHPS